MFHVRKRPRWSSPEIQLFLCQYRILCCIVDGYYCCVVVVRHCFFLQDCVIYCMSVITLFHCASPRLSVPRTLCFFTLLFLSQQTRHRTKMFSFYLFLIMYGGAKCYGASNVWGHECKSSGFVLQLQSAEYVERWRAALNEAVHSVGVNCNEETHIRDLNSIQFTCNSIIHCLCTINSSTVDVGIIASVCSLNNSPS